MTQPRNHTQQRIDVIAIPTDSCQHRNRKGDPCEDCIEASLPLLRDTRNPMFAKGGRHGDRPENSPNAKRERLGAMVYRGGDVMWRQGRGRY